MSRSATSSEPGAPSGSSRVVALIVTVATALLTWTGLAHAQVRLTREEALELAFPGPARIERQTAYLEREQRERVEAMAGADAGGGVVTYYVGRSDAGPLGVAYFDVHRVRTMPEVLMIVIDPAGRVDRIEILSFAEPHEYMAPEGWLARFEGRGLPRGPGREDAVVGITGATLTSRAVSGAVRRTLALNELLDPLGKADAPGMRQAP